MKILSIVGVRPQYVKMSKIMSLLSKDPEVKHIIINTGQHYDYELAQSFFENLNISDADYNLEVGSGSHAEQTAKGLLAMEKIIIEHKPDCILVVGDANSTLTGALVAAKMNIPVAHIEAGLRSYNWEMAEEKNRILVDHCSTFLFAPTENAKNILLREGISEEKIFITGDVTVDIIRNNIEKAKESEIIKNLKITGDFILLTLHRPETTDYKEEMEKIFSTLSHHENIVFPIHPRTKKKLKEYKLEHYLEKMKVIDPLSYFDFLNLMLNCKLVITDSGGIQKEAFLVNKPCVTLRPQTEWIETAELGANIVTGSDPKKINSAIKEMSKKELNIEDNPYGIGKASERTIKILKENLRGN